MLPFGLRQRLPRGLFRRCGGEILFCSRPKKNPKNAAQKPMVFENFLCPTDAAEISPGAWSTNRLCSFPRALRPASRLLILLAIQPPRLHTYTTMQWGGEKRQRSAISTKIAVGAVGKTQAPSTGIAPARNARRKPQGQIRQRAPWLR